MVNIFKTIFDAITGNSKLPLSDEMLVEAEKLWDVKDGNWTPEQKKLFGNELNIYQKDGSAGSLEKKAFFAKLAESQKPPVKEEKTSTYTYRCVTNCTYEGRYFKEGETIELPEKKEVPHFKLGEEGGV